MQAITIYTVDYPEGIFVGLGYSIPKGAPQFIGPIINNTQRTQYLRPATKEYLNALVV